MAAIWYPFRPSRFERLGYAKWQRTDPRWVEIVVVWPILAMLTGMLAVLATVDSAIEFDARLPTSLGLYGLACCWGAVSIALAWRRRVSVA